MCLCNVYEFGEMKEKHIETWCILARKNVQFVHERTDAQ